MFNPAFAGRRDKACAAQAKPQRTEHIADNKTDMTKQRIIKQDQRGFGIRVVDCFHFF